MVRLEDAPLPDAPGLYAIRAMKILKRIAVGLISLVVLLWAGLTVWAYWPGEPEVPIASLATADDKFVEVDGVRLRYREWGSADSEVPSLLLIHGFGNSLQSFRELAPRLADCCHVVASDMAGYGLSEKPVDFD